MKPKNPFRPTRFEFHDRPLIWVSPLIRGISGFDSHFLCGTRGSGKTSLLKTMHWRERLSNASLRAQLQSDFTDYIGVYFKITDYTSFSFSDVDWRSVYPGAADCTSISFHYFSMFIEAIAVEQLADAASTLRQKGVFSFTAEQEREFVSRFVKKYKALSSFSEMGAIKYLDDVSFAASAMRIEMNWATVRGTVGEIDSLLPRSEGGAMINDFATLLSDLVKDGSGGYHVKICLDDCEALVDEQRVFLNTMVRKARHPVAWVLSYVDENYDATTTLIHGQRLTDADRKVINIDSFSHQEFEKFCEEVSNLRLYYYGSIAGDVDGDNIGDGINLKSILGATNINKLLLASKDKSLGADFGKLRSRVQASVARLKETRRPVSHAQAKRNSSAKAVRAASEGEDLPIYQYYVVEKLMPHASPEDVLWVRDPAFNAYLRHKQRAALLSMCSEYGFTSIPYSGKNVVLAMSDNCIRDYLEIMAEIYDAYEREYRITPRQFRTLTKPIPQNIQREGIRKASESKFNGIWNLTEAYKGEASKLVECLGRLVGRLQGNHRDLEVLKTPERGILALEFPHTLLDDLAKKKIALVRAVINRLLLDGLLKYSRANKPGKQVFLESEGEECLLRLHRRFAAYFGFSYQGPYYPVKIPIDDVVSICIDPKSVNVEEWVNRVYRKIGQWEPSQTEFKFQSEKGP